MAGEEVDPVEQAKKIGEHKLAQEAQELFDEAAKLFIGKPAAVQGNAIAILFGTWLHGHRAATKEDTRKVRGRLLQMTVEMAIRQAQAMDDQEAKGPETKQ